MEQNLLQHLDSDVLIVGSGPTGLMLANQLGRRGIRTIIIDRHGGPSTQTRALGVQARTMEIYAKLGVIDEALAQGKRAQGANLWSQGRRMARIPLGDIGQTLSAFPFLLILGQDNNERILGARLLDWGLTVQWNTELVALEQFSDHASATLKQPDGTTREINAAWVAGCDGAHSAVRQLSGIEFVGEPYPHVFFVADVSAVGSMVQDELNVYLRQRGFHLFFPMPGKDHWRVVGILPEELRKRDDLRFDDVAPSVQVDAGIPLTFKSCHWFSVYRIQHRCAARFRQGRCLLLGDAAHIHSPVGAQGMNTGLQDAYNLAWKLGLVLQGQAQEALLDTYAHERMPVARRLLATTDQAFKVVVSDSAIAALLRTKVLARLAALAMRFRPVRRLAFLTVSQTGIAYRDSVLSWRRVSMPRRSPRPGERFPWLHLEFQGCAGAQDLFERLSDLHFNLLVFGQATPAPGAWPLGSAIESHDVADSDANRSELKRTGIPGLCYYLLRPDGHIACCGLRLDFGVIQAYFDKLGWPGPSDS